MSTKLPHLPKDLLSDWRGTLSKIIAECLSRSILENMVNGDSPKEGRIISNKSSVNIPLKTHAEYMAFHKKIDTSGRKTSDAEFGKILFSPKASNKTLKEVLLILAHRRTPEAYTILKRYVKKPAKGLSAWAMLALNECRMFVESDLCEEETTMVITGAGGDGERLRYYVVVHTAVGARICSQQKHTVTVHFSEAAEELSCAVEKITAKKDHVLLQIVVPFDVAVGDFIERGLERCNRKSHLFCDSYMVTNVGKPNVNDIEKFIRSCPSIAGSQS